MHLAPLLSLALPLLYAGLAEAATPKNAILLSKVKSLTLRADKLTTHRRVSAIPQLACEGPGCKYHKVDIMRCQNMGSDYEQEDIQWSCTASLPREFRLGATEVICEGYASSSDPFVLKGSCGVSYRLLFTEAGEERYGGSWFKGWGSDSASKTDLGGWLFMALWVGVALWMLYKFLTAVQAAPQGRGPRRWGGNWGTGWGGGPGGGGGGGHDGWDDPPPPYPGKFSSSSRNPGWRPGFWSGTAAGAAAGYLAGQRARGPETREVPRTGGWFGGGGPAARSGSSNWSERPGSGSRGGSSSRHESSGFGSTTRR
ncbi:hypothetical protein B0O99DRAFT_648136 [Bisporella sp. PMI_857]|nr:hypothetical protein B0O99DRAFT_648136 [Bisporella sp. PMI_857]